MRRWIVAAAFVFVPCSIISPLDTFYANRILVEFFAFENLLRALNSLSHLMAICAVVAAIIPLKFQEIVVVVAGTLAFLLRAATAVVVRYHYAGTIGEIAECCSLAIPAFIALAWAPAWAYLPNPRVERWATLVAPPLALFSIVGGLCHSFMISEIPTSLFGLSGQPAPKLPGYQWGIAALMTSVILYATSLIMSVSLLRFVRTQNARPALVLGFVMVGLVVLRSVFDVIPMTQPGLSHEGFETRDYIHWLVNLASNLALMALVLTGSIQILAKNPESGMQRDPPA